MIIKNIIINNYKSIGNKRNKLEVDEYVTVLIGKNESGKSNILEAIGEQQIVNKLNPQIFNNKNRMNGEEISIDIVKENADEITLSNDEDRVAVFLDKMLKEMEEN